MLYSLLTTIEKKEVETKINTLLGSSILTDTFHERVLISLNGSRKGIFLISKANLDLLTKIDSNSKNTNCKLIHACILGKEEFLFVTPTTTFESTSMQASKFFSNNAWFLQSPTLYRRTSPGDIHLSNGKYRTSRSTNRHKQATASNLSGLFFVNKKVSFLNKLLL